LSNATIQQRVIAVRSFYGFLVEDGLRERNPVRRGQSPDALYTNEFIDPSIRMG
jgi:site-specific recombinase XerD